LAVAFWKHKVAATAKIEFFSQPGVNAGIAQLVEQLICNQQVIGSNPIAGSVEYQRFTQFEPCHEISRLDTSWTLFGIWLSLLDWF
jgi:hypothetical protein